MSVTDQTRPIGRQQFPRHLGHLPRHREPGEPARSPLLRCSACGELDYHTIEELCDSCGFQPTCATCGTDLDPIDYEPERRSVCSRHCWLEALGWANADRR